MSVEPDFLDARHVDKLAALVMELAAQLHVERQRRMALERALIEAGTVTPAAIEALAGDARFLEAARAEADASIRKLLRIMSEAGPAEAPLRAEAVKA